MHGVGDKRYRRLPYLAADPKSNSEAGERRRRHGLEAAARTKAAAALEELGFGAAVARAWDRAVQRSAAP
jgi:hypothetical protein